MTRFWIIITPFLKTRQARVFILFHLLLLAVSNPAFHNQNSVSAQSCSVATCVYRGDGFPLAERYICSCDHTSLCEKFCDSPDAYCQYGSPEGCHVNCGGCDGNGGGGETCDYEWEDTYVQDGCPAGSNVGVWARYYRLDGTNYYPPNRIVLNRVETSVHHPRGSLIGVAPISCKGYSYRYKGYFRAWETGSYSFRNILPQGHAAFELINATTGTLITSWNSPISNTCAINSPTRTVTLEANTWYEYTIEGFQSETDEWGEDCIRLDYIGPNMAAYSFFGVQPSGIAETVFRPCSLPPPTPTLAPPNNTQLSCVYPNGPIQLNWTYPISPNPPFFGIARTSGINLGLTPPPVPSWNYLHSVVGGSNNVLNDTNNIQPGYRYDYNTRACYDSACNSQGSYGNQVYTSCTVRAWCQNMSVTLAPSPGCWVEGGVNKCWRGQSISGVASGYNGSSPSNPPPFDATSGWSVENVVKKVGISGALSSNPAPNISYVIPTTTCGEVGSVCIGDTLEIVTNVRWGSSNLCVRGDTWGTSPHPGAVCDNDCVKEVQIACNPNVYTDTSCSETSPGVCTFDRTTECAVTTTLPCTCPTGTPPNSTPTATTTPSVTPPNNTPTNTPTTSPPTPTLNPPTPTLTPTIAPPTPSPTPSPSPTPTPTVPVGEPTFGGNLFYDFNNNGIFDQTCSPSRASEWIGHSTFGCKGQAGVCTDDCSPRSQLQSLLGVNDYRDGLQGFRIFVSPASAGGIVYSANPQTVIKPNWSSYYGFAVRNSNTYLVSVSDPLSQPPVQSRNCLITTPRTFSVYVGTTNNTNNYRIGVYCAPTPTPTNTTPTPTNTTPTPTDTPIPNYTSWWQQKGGLHFTKENISSLAADDSQFLITKLANDSPLTAGLPMCGGSIEVTNGNYSEYLLNGASNPHLHNSSLNDYCLNFSFDFYRNLIPNISSNEAGNTERELLEDTTITVTDMSGGTNAENDNIYDIEYSYYDSDVVFAPSSTWQYDQSNTPLSRIYLVNGDATFSSENLISLSSLIRVEPGVFVAFIVKGNIIIKSNVGETPSVFAGLDGRGVMEGFYLADGQIIIQTTGPGHESNELQFVGAGSFAGCNGVVLSRSFSGANNYFYPAELFVYRPDFLLFAPKAISKSRIKWSDLQL